MRRFRSTVLGAALLALALVAAACAEEPGGDGTPEAKASLTVGADNFAEAEIVAEMYAQVLENAGYDVSRKFGTTRETRIPAMESGEIDLAPEYLATLLLFLDPNAEASSDAQAVAGDLNPLLEEKGLTTLEASAAVDTNAFVVTQETAQEHGLETVSDLAAVAGDLTLGGPPECPERPFCIPGLKDVYGVEFGKFVPLDAGGPLTVEALDTGEIDVALLFSTQSVIVDKGWVVLQDDKGLQAADNITPLIRTDLVNDEITGLLNGVSASLTTEIMLGLNGRVEIDGEDAADVAQDFLTEQGLA
ncbi:MAG TPA: ABC transporter substrate-binding protein [Actinomycetota bacterium]|jgi:osmoprotectant transport system substrate-binding protein|nr:ABC transporter substrate-binding protein [Actinomycetota bacterium]